MKTPGDMIQSRMKQYSMTNYKLAKLAGVSPTAIGELISGKRGVTAYMAVRLNGALDISPAELMAAQAAIDIEDAMKQYKEESA